MTASLKCITEFRGAFSFLSNFYRYPFVYRNLIFATSEHAFHWEKTDDLVAKSDIIQAATPQEAKAIGRNVTLAPGWQEYRRYFAMEGILQSKFAPATQMAAWLLGTGQSILVEGNRWHDNDWGCCLCSKCVGTGRNLLGWMLMRQRYLLTQGL